MYSVALRRERSLQLQTQLVAEKHSLRKLAPSVPAAALHHGPRSGCPSAPGPTASVAESSLLRAAFPKFPPAPPKKAVAGAVSKQAAPSARSLPYFIKPSAVLGGAVPLAKVASRSSAKRDTAVALARDPKLLHQLLASLDSPQEVFLFCHSHKVVFRSMTERESVFQRSFLLLLLGKGN